MSPVMVLGIRKAVLGIFPREENAQDWSCDGPGHLLWCHMSPVMVLGIRKGVLGPGPGLGPRTAFLIPRTITDDKRCQNQWSGLLTLYQDR